MAEPNGSWSSPRRAARAPESRRIIARRAAILAILAVALLRPLFPQLPDPSTAAPRAAPPTTRLLRIGYVRPAGESDFTRAQMERLRAFLLADEATARLMPERGYTGIGLFETDGGRDMLTRLNAREFDVAFVPTRVWHDQQAGYTIILQTRRLRDVISTRGNLVLQHGVVFISPRSPFFRAEVIDRAEFARYLATQRMAVEQSQSLAGFIAPLTELAREYNMTAPTQDFLWCRSSAEVTKTVLSGLVDVGVCEEGGLEETLEAAGVLEQRDNLRAIVVRSRPVPTDPVVVRADLAPAASELGRELKRALRDFSLQDGFGHVSLQSAQDRDYDGVRLILDEFDRSYGDLRR